MKRLLKSALIFLPLVMVIFCVNYYVDPASLLNKSLEKEIAAAFLSGHNVADVTTIDDRAMIDFYFDQREKEIDCLVLGASRGMQISAQTTGIENTFNSGVTGAEFRDIVSIYYMYREKFDVPENVIVVLEPWTISEAYVSKRCITEGYYEFCKKNNLNAFETNNFRAELDKFLEMFSIGYFQQSINPVFSGDFNLKKEISITDRLYGDSDIRHYDGSYSYSSSYISASEIEKQTAIYDKKTNIPDLIRTYRYNDELANQLRFFVKELVSDGANVTLFIPPILPEYYNFIMNETSYGKCFTQTWELYTDIARENNIPIIGDYNNPALSSDDFYDIMHPTYEYVYRLFTDYRTN